jgi:glycosyltransferase involved in cell wall biosynthesis
MGCSVEDIPSEQPAAARIEKVRFGQVLFELDRLFPVVGHIRARVSAPFDYRNKLLHFHPDRHTWRGRSGLSPAIFRERSRAVERELSRRQDEFDLVFETQTLFAPGMRLEWPYVVYTDNTYTLTRRYYPEWAPLRRGAGDRWAELEGETLRGARFVFTMSDFAREGLVDDYGCDPDRVVFAGAGATLRDSPPPERDYGACIALFVGMDFERKGGRLLLEAWPSVTRKVPAAELWIVGPRQEPPAALPTGVRWMGYLPSRADVADAYRRASVFAFPTLFEPLGLVVLEAMGHGLPVVGPDFAGPGEIVCHGETGLLVPRGEVAPLAEALATLLSDPALAERMGRRGHREVLERHTWAHVAERMAPWIERATVSA